MKKLMVVLFVAIIMALSMPSFAQVDIDGPETHGVFSPISGANAQAGATASATGGTGGAGGNATINDNSRTTNLNTNVNTNTNLNTAVQGQNQNQGQRQGQGQLQGQMNDWNQTFEAPRDLLSAPQLTPPQVQILPGKMWRVNPKELPNIGILPYNGEEYVKAISYNGSFVNRIRAEDVAEDLLTFRDRVLGKVDWVKSKIRLEVIAREAGESTSTSGAGTGSYSGNLTPASGVASTLGLFPGKSRWKADYQYSCIFYLLK